jgi:hypothetical protein
MTRNSGSRTRYRFHMRRGSCARRKSHSSPVSLIHLGARLAVPAMKSSAAPTPRSTAGRSSGAASEIQSSCLGAPSATSTRSAFAALTRSRTGARADAGASMSMRGASVPVITMRGKRSTSRSAARAPTPGAPPRMYTRQPSRAARSISGSTRSDPEIFSGSGLPSKRDAQRIGIPSASERSTAS